MSDLPQEARARMELARRDHEPSAERLEQIRLAVLARVAVGAPLRERSARDTLSRLRRHWRWIGLATLTLSLSGLLLQSADRREATPAAEPTEQARAQASSASFRQREQPTVSTLSAAPQRPDAASVKTKPTLVAAAADRAQHAAENALPASRARQEAVSPTHVRPRERSSPSAPLRSDGPASAQQPVPPTPEQPLAPAPLATGQDTTLSVRQSGRPVEDLLGDEVRLIASARRALSQTDDATAQRLLAEHARRFPAGQLQTERAALWTRERCLAGDRTGALARYRELRLLAPSSALVPGVRQACGPLLDP